MVYRILSKLFSRDEYESEYKAKPSHLFYSVLLMGIGSKSMLYEGWGLFGGLTLTLGFLLGLSILLCIDWDKVNAYWMIINEHIILMNKSNPDIWVALGYSKPANKVEVIEKQDKGQGSFSWKISQVPVSPSQMNLVANKVLGSGSLDLSEEMYSSIIPNFRKVRKQWITDGILVPKNKKNVKNGYCLSRKGLNIMYQFASDHMKLKEGE